MEVVLEMAFLFFNNVNLQFSTRELTWKPYTTAETMPIAYQVELIHKLKFAKVALDKASKTFVVHIAALEHSLRIIIHPSWATQALQETIQLAAPQ